MTLNMRPLQGDDLFTVLSILGKLDVEKEVKELIEVNIESDAESKIIILQDHKEKKPTKKEQENKQIEKIQRDKEKALRTSQFGADMILKLVRNANHLKHEINPFLADLTGTDENTIKSLPLSEYVQLLKDFFQKEELKDFLSSIASFLK